MILADSTILIDLSRGYEEAILFCDGERKNGQNIAISVMSCVVWQLANKLSLDVADLIKSFP